MYFYQFTYTRVEPCCGVHHTYGVVVVLICILWPYTTTTPHQWCTCGVHHTSGVPVAYTTLVVYLQSIDLHYNRVLLQCAPQLCCSCGANLHILAIHHNYTTTTPHLCHTIWWCSCGVHHIFWYTYTSTYLHHHYIHHNYTTILQGQAMKNWLSSTFKYIDLVSIKYLNFKTQWIP